LRSQLNPSNHERTNHQLFAYFPFTPFDWFRTGFDKLKTNGKLDQSFPGATGSRTYFYFYYPMAPRAALLARLAARFSFMVFSGAFLVCFLLSMPLLIVILLIH